MSHFSRVQTKMTDQDCLHSALVGLKYDVVSRALVRGFTGRTVEADLVVRPGGSFDIGFERQSDGAFTLVADWWGVEREAGVREAEFLPPVLQRYAYEVVCREMVSQGFQLVRESVAADQSVQLTLRRWP